MPGAADWAPTTSDVGALLRARTKDRSGNELGDFTANTRPTGVQVEALIEQATSDIDEALSVLGPIPENLYGLARRVAGLGTALGVELGYFPEQVGTGRSPYAQIKDMYDDRLKVLRSSIEAAGGDVPGDATSGPPAPVWTFPDSPGRTVNDLGLNGLELPVVRLPGGRVVATRTDGLTW